MPSNLMFADASFPKIEQGEDPQASIRKIQNYLFMLLEQLRYTLQNLGEGNFNSADMEAYVKRLAAGLVVADTIISNTFITNELYAQYGSIADLTVDKLRTDYRRALKYLAGDTSQLDYIYIHDETISFITATTDGGTREQLNVDGRRFWWTDGDKTQMTSEKNTGIPVYVYVYEELTKAEFRFQNITVGAEQTATVMPVMIWGAGTGAGDNGKCYLYKAADGMHLRYHKKDGTGTAELVLSDGGVMVGTASAGVRNIVEVPTSQFDPAAVYPLGTVVAVLEE